MAKTYVMVLGIIFLLLGLLGFVGPFVSDGNLFGVLAAGTSLNIVYLLSGAIGVGIAVGKVEYAPLYAKVFGVIYGLMAVFGLMVGEGSILNLFDVNQASNVLHLVIAASALYVGFANGSKARPAAA